MPGIWKDESARIVAVCDLDSKRSEDAKTLVNGHDATQTGKPYDSVATYKSYRDLVASNDVVQAPWVAALPRSTVSG